MPGNGSAQIRAVEYQSRRSFLQRWRQATNPALFDTYIRAAPRGCGVFLGLIYVVKPKLSRYSMGLRKPRDSLIRFLLYQLIYESKA